LVAGRERRGDATEDPGSPTLDRSGEKGNLTAMHGLSASEIVPWCSWQSLSSRCRQVPPFYRGETEMQRGPGAHRSLKAAKASIQIVCLR
jgi:hypothetical protein